MNLSLRDYQQASIRTMPKMIEGQYEFYYDNEAVKNYCFGLIGETGEFVDLIKKALYHGHPLDDEKAMKELGDVLHYLSGLCTMLGFSLEHVATMNLDKLSKRYPVGFSVEDSKKRVDVREEKKTEVKNVNSATSYEVKRVKDAINKIYGKNRKEEEPKANDILKLLNQLTPEGRKFVLKQWGVE